MSASTTAPTSAELSTIVFTVSDATAVWPVSEASVGGQAGLVEDGRKLCVELARRLDRLGVERGRVKDCHEPRSIAVFRDEDVRRRVSRLLAWTDHPGDAGHVLDSVLDARKTLLLLPDARAFEEHDRGRQHPGGETAVGGDRGLLNLRVRTAGRFRA